MITALEKLRMKHIALTKKEKSDLIGQLTLDEKMLFASYLLDDEIYIETLNNSDMNELEPESDLNYNKTTYRDGLEVFISNKE